MEEVDSLSAKVELLERAVGGLVEEGGSGIILGAGEDGVVGASPRVEGGQIQVVEFGLGGVVVADKLRLQHVLLARRPEVGVDGALGEEFVAVVEANGQGKTHGGRRESEDGEDLHLVGFGWIRLKAYECGRR